MRISIQLLVTICIIVFACSKLEASPLSSSASSGTEAKLKLFAVEIKVGPNWDSSKAPNEQAFFKEHSTNLKKLREAGHIVMGARYSDIGLIIFSANSPEEVKAFMEKDPSMSAGTFKYEVHTFNVFYPGLVQSRSKE
ncbi:YciI family protein [Aliikangiella coralliicola]|uniref:YCII-related domain-containing protein n=1 Tax=Aliikangiella coralliicola TaxID=2592383 RepID=A0A545UFM4_9GAMM|nr:YciI family protein [Aliikangiella coralliicola]TQV88271.1 hypothetical protein FLL46_07015 [Aliikangiella coralliicola]